MEEKEKEQDQKQEQKQKANEKINQIATVPKSKASELSFYSTLISNPKQLHGLIENYLIKSASIKGKFKSTDEAMQAALYGMELGFGLSQALNSVDVINGKPTLDTHGIRACLLSHGVVTKTLKEYETIKVKKKKKDSSEVVSVNKMIPLSNGQAIPDRITEIEFTREIKLPHSNKIITMVEIGRYTWEEVMITGSTNPTLNKHPKRMLYKLAYADGAHKIGSDLIKGMLGRDELHGSTNQMFTEEDLNF